MLRTVLASATAALALAGVPAVASASSADCPQHRGTLAVKPLGRVWHHAGSVYACTTVYGHKPRSRRMGPWTSTTKVAFDGVDLVWTVRRAGGDRLFAGDADDGRRWLSGARAVPPSGASPGRESRVATLLQRDTGGAWVTRDGDVVMALHDPQDQPTAIGTLPGALAPTNHVLLVGSYPGADLAQLGTSLALDELDGDGDECGGANPYRLTFRTDPAAPLAGATWTGYWTSTNCS